MPTAQTNAQTDAPTESLYYITDVSDTVSNIVNSILKEPRGHSATLPPKFGLNIKIFGTSAHYVGSTVIWPVLSLVLGLVRHKKERFQVGNASMLPCQAARSLPPFLV